MLEVRLGDCIDGMAALDAESVDAVVCDPPYGLGAQPPIEDVLRSWLAGEKWIPRGGGFMGAEWDAFVPDPAAWRECYRVLKPGGHLVAFAGTRTVDLVALGLRLAGFEIRDLLAYLFGSGFPKSLDVSKAIDAKLGAEREVVGERRIGRLAVAPGQGEDRSSVSVSVSASATPWAEQWEGFGTALKPAHEPIVLARKPLNGTVAENVLQHGTGALNIDATKIGTTGGIKSVPGSRPKPEGSTAFPGHASEVTDAGGRWPANVLLCHHESCRGWGAKRSGELCHPECPVRMMNEQSGESLSQGIAKWGDHDRGGRVYELPNVNEGKEIGYGDRGGAARFFYTAKAQRKERIAGVERSLHPTVKPVAVMRWLIRLVTPPGGLVLDPFTGSGTTGVAAVQEGFDFLGFEQDETYARQAAERIADHAFARGRKLTSPPPSGTTAPSTGNRDTRDPDNPEEGNGEQEGVRQAGGDRRAARGGRSAADQAGDRGGGEACPDEGQDSDGDGRGDDLHGREEGLADVRDRGARSGRARRSAAEREGGGAGGRVESGGDARDGRRPRRQRQERGEAGPKAEGQEPPEGDGIDATTTTDPRPGRDHVTVEAPAVSEGSAPTRERAPLEPTKED
jgi:DNA modification methylase